ncbi:MAG TPA: hypothetical protein VG389_22655 [Myxococcota bacterium]|nr:hypothetical protein [Myxococcota bacterium]
MEAATTQPEPGRPWGNAYRDDRAALRWRRASARESFGRALAGVPGAVRAVYARRVARALGGAAATATGLAMFLAAIGRATGVLNDEQRAGLLTHVLFAGWAIGVAVYFAALPLARTWLGFLLRRALRDTRDPHADLARLERASPTRLATEHADRHELWATALPLTALVFLVPLTLHFPIGWLLDDSMKARDFDRWIAMSAVIVGHAHLALAALCVRFARQARRRPLASLRRAGWKAYGITVAVSAVPGVALFALPPVIVALTGLIPVPCMFAAAHAVLERERGVLLAAHSSP